MPRDRCTQISADKKKSLKHGIDKNTEKIRNYKFQTRTCGDNLRCSVATPARPSPAEPARGGGRPARLRRGQAAWSPPATN
jgi:hypothetical protein